MASNEQPTAPTLSAALRDAIRNSELNQNRLGVAAGVSPIVIGRFVSGERDLQMETADKLAAILGKYLIGSTSTKTSPKSRTLSEALRAAIEDSDLSMYRIATDAEVSPSVLGRFVSRERDIRLETADKLVAMLGLQLTEGAMLEICTTDAEILGAHEVETVSENRTPRPPTLSDTLRAAVAESGLTSYRLATDAEVSASVLGRFLSGERDIRMETADKLAAVLGLRLVKGEMT